MRKCLLHDCWFSDGCYALLLYCSNLQPLPPTITYKLNDKVRDCPVVTEIFMLCNLPQLVITVFVE